jgi:RHS repeat-associated protein
VVTNLRLPGQYDERLLGSLGLQGPYYNWNRWYLPGVGRYMELDPLALRGGANGPFGPDWYNYANGNPLRYTDPWGLYGTNDCSYYKQRCAESGGKYYCDQAQYWCEWFGDTFGRPPDPTRTATMTTRAGLGVRANASKTATATRIGTRRPAL